MPSLIGNKPNQVPTNADLGTLAFQDANAVNITGGTASLTSVASPSVTNAGTLALSATGANAITASTNGAVRATLDASGNLGLGVVPRAWNAGSFHAFQVGAGASLTGRAAGQASPLDEMYLSANAYNDNAWKYIGTAAATQYLQDAGTHIWRVAPSGTANATITFTQAMTLDVNGNLIQSAPTTPPALTTNGQMVFNLTSNTNLRVSVRGSDGVTRTANIVLI